MRLITRQSEANDAPQRWAVQYSGKGYTQEQYEITRTLAALSAPIDPDEVDRIIGNTSWTTPPSCGVCGKFAPAIAEIGEESDYRSSTAHVCRPCAEKALALFDVAK